MEGHARGGLLSARVLMVGRALPTVASKHDPLLALAHHPLEVVEDHMRIVPHGHRAKIDERRTLRRGDLVSW